MSSPLMSIVIKPVESDAAADKEEKDGGSFLYMVCPVKMKD